jgi:hypothetical protein
MSETAEETFRARAKGPMAHGPQGHGWGQARAMAEATTVRIGHLT